MGSNYKDILRDSTPWTRRTIGAFKTAGLITVLMVILSYTLLWLGYKGTIPAWVAFLSEGATVGITGTAILLALKQRKRDVEKARKTGSPGHP